MDGPEPKRRKVRKGTHTCWECKRRKVRCMLANPGDTVCIGCTKRCLPCVSQEFPEDQTTATVKSRLVGDRIVRVEAMIQQLVHQSGQQLPLMQPQPQQTSPPLHHQSREHSPDTSTTAFSVSATAVSGMPTPAASDRSKTPLLSSLPPSLVARTSGNHRQSCEELSAALLDVYPPQQDLDLITSCSHSAYNQYQIMMRSQRDIKTSGFWPPDELRIRYTPQTHPVLIARQMLVIAMVLQGSDPVAQKELHDGRLSEPVRGIVTRLGETAIRLVTSNEPLLDTLGTLDGLECVMLEAMYLHNGGKLRRSWLSWRRALSLAQLMCIPRRPQRNPSSASTTTTMSAGASATSKFTSLSMSRTQSLSPQFLWYRIIFAERFLCLLLGLPQASFEAPIASPEALRNDTPLGILEQKLSTITSYILDRNERGPRQDDYTATEKIDREMQRIAATLPSRWWLAPNLAALSPGDHDQGVWEMVRLTSQVVYYNILNQLHLPYMLHPQSSSGTITAADQRRLEYSRTASVSASREVLSRYVLFRGFNRSACCCRLLEFFALMASLTLILVHIDGHRHTARNGPASNVLAHQRVSDRAMMEEALDSMDLVGKLNEEDTISGTSVDLLRQLLAIEADTARGSSEALESLCNTSNGSNGLGFTPNVGSCDAVCDSTGHGANDGGSGNGSLEGGADTSNRAAAAAGKLRISVPYVGYITIARDGEIAKEAYPPQDEPAPTYASSSREGTAVASLVSSVSPVPSVPSVPSAPSVQSVQSVQSVPLSSAPQKQCTAQPALGAPLQQQQHNLHGMMTGINDQAPFPTCLSVNGNSPPTSQAPVNPFYPLAGAAAYGTSGAADPWAFQGVDMAFFDSLMRETSNVEPPRGSNNALGSIGRESLWPLHDQQQAAGRM
ncbi:hypothetical protein SEPCBS119000_002152 [Sporothrix epigloea]|uniref:Zn(2)-C6 fungal-type domain-containing protein n=1 Tax=Sporothrix epigloea TaxID=1892477 RepID=A0ABP0DEL5_9PEZI